MTSDVSDTGEVEANVAYNFGLNGLPRARHVTHTWGTGWPEGEEDEFDVILASDILLYVSAYPALVKTLGELLRGEAKGGGMEEERKEKRK